jgi:TRAP transporter TAXI family solute receptor
VGIAFVFVLAAVAVLVRHNRTEPQIMVLGAGAQGTESFELAEAIAEVVNRHHRRVSLIVVATQGSIQNAELLRQGRLDFATIQADVPTSAGIRLVAPLYVNAFQLVAREDSGIRSLGDLRGRIVALPPAGSAGARSFWAVAEHFGLALDDLQAVTMTSEAASWAMGSGSVDAFFQTKVPGSAAVRESLQLDGGTIVPIDQAAAIQLRLPAVEPGIIPKGSYRGEPPLPAADLPTPVVWQLLATRAGLEPAVVNSVTEILFERRRELTELSPMAGFIRAPNMTSGTFMPVHDGAQAYYAREEPSFLQENAELIALVLSIIVLGLSSLLRVADQGRKRRLEEFNAEVLAVYSEAQDLDDPDAIRARRQDLVRVLARVLDDAEEGKVTEEGFQMFSLAWNAVDGSLRDRLALDRREEADE